MAQREEEAELRIPETVTLCVNNCGFHGNPAMKNMCPSCFQAAGRDGPSSTPSSCPGHEKHRSAPIRTLEREVSGGEVGIGPKAETTVATSARQVNRCAGCRRRVGLMGFRCRCGELFCGEHRYSDRHVCSYDYKSAGREAIARENPVVRAAKIVRV